MNSRTTQGNMYIVVERRDRKVLASALSHYKESLESNTEDDVTASLASVERLRRLVWEARRVRHEWAGVAHLAWLREGVLGAGQSVVSWWGARARDGWPDMSSTNRGAVRDLDDYYATPPELAKLICQRLARDLTVPEKVENVLEPGCGAGSFLVAAREAWPKAAIEGYELNPDLAAKARSKGFTVHEGDVLRTELPEWDVIVGNPPFKHAEEFIQKLAPHGTRALKRTRRGYTSLTTEDVENKWRGGSYEDPRRNWFPMSRESQLEATF